jgi:hypothetical protein
MAAFRDTIYNINGSATGFDTVLASSPPAAAAGSNIPVTLGFCRDMHVVETFAAGSSPNPQGLQVQFYNRETQSWGPTIQIAPGDVVDADDYIPEGQGQGSVLGLPYQKAMFPDARGTTSRPADTPMRIISGSTSSTLIRVRESQ